MVGRWLIAGVAVLAAGCGRRAEPPDFDAPVVYDFAARLEHARVERPWVALDLGDTASRAWLLDGWGPIEEAPDGTRSAWITHKRAGVRFALYEPRDLILSAYLYPYTRTYIGQAVALEVNGARVGRWALDGREAFREYKATIPKSVLQRGENTLRFRFRYASRRKRQAANVARLELGGIPPETAAGTTVPSAGPEGWRQPAKTLVRWPVTVPRRGWLEAWPRFSGAGPDDTARVWIRTDRGRFALAAVGEEPAAPLRASLVPYAGERGFIEFESTGPQDVEWTVCRAGGRIRPEDANLYLITIDSLRADHVGVYGYARPTTPALDALAGRGTVFKTAYSQSNVSMPSFSTILTGRYPQSHGTYMNGVPMDRQQRPLAAILGAHGYETAAYVNWSILSWEKMTGRGFEKRRSIEGVPETARPVMGRGNVFGYALNWADYHAGARQFLWLQTEYLHLRGLPEAYREMFVEPAGAGEADTGRAPLAEAVRTGGEALREAMRRYTDRETEMTEREYEAFVALYDGAIRLSDDQLGGFLRGLERLGLDPYAAFIVTADHGMSLGEHHRLSHLGMPYPHLLHVPLVMVLPGSGQAAGRHIEAPVALTDLVPTVLDYLGLQVPRRLQGRSLMPYIRGETPPPREAAFAVVPTDPPSYAITTARWHYHTDFKERAFLTAVDDPEETQELDAHPETAARLRAALEAWVRQTPNVCTGVEGELSEEVKHILKQAGYL
ncbi:MAG: sulfatase-like hydrolase/transferase [Phycisphaerae bacterium]|nr:sulfatase-like hydrolase/transferase [Phycisphaerae bacterium]